MLAFVVLMVASGSAAIAQSDPPATLLARARADVTVLAPSSPPSSPGTPDPPPPAEPAAAAEGAPGGDEPVSSGWAGAPVVYYSPETQLGLGGFVVHFFRPFDEPVTSRTSSLSVVAFATTREQGVLEVFPELYFDRERWHLWAKLDLRLFPDSFWGIGNDVEDLPEIRFDQTVLRGRLVLRRRIQSAVWLGMAADVQDVEVGPTPANSAFSMPEVLGEEGARTAGAALTLGWDDRDHAVEARSGGYHQLELWGFARAVGSQYEFVRAVFDLRQYVPLGGTHVLALELRAVLQHGQIPFTEMAMLGGSRLLRGYFEGRYRDASSIAAQAEYRFPIAWRLRGVVFAGAGEVADRPEHFGTGHIRWAAGGGLRLVLNEQERLAIRADVGFGPGTWGAYFTAGEAF